MPVPKPPVPAPIPDPDPIEDLLVQLLERLEAAPDEQEAVLGAFCAEHPDEAPALRERYLELARFDLLREDADDADDAHRGPERLGGFRILERIGSGGMGVVYRAWEENLQREVALKVVRPDQLHSASARERFAREVEAIGRMQHPGIVPVHSFGTDGDVPYFAMELVRGASLQDLLTHLAGTRPRRGRALWEALGKHTSLAAEDAGDGSMPELFAGTWEEASLRIVASACEALAHAHARGVRHRDLKPSNLMVTRDGRVQLLDFGLSRVESAERATLTVAPVGSLLYMPPELVAEDPGADPVLGDVYSLGATLFELLAGRPAFDERPAPSLLVAIARGERQRLRTLRSDLSRDAATVCETAMEVAPERRYASADAFARDLRNVLARRPIEARPAGPGLRLLRFAQRHPTRSVAVLLGALLVLGTPSLIAFRERSAARELAELNRDLGAALQEATSQRSAAEDARANAESARRRAETHFETAFDVIGTLLARTGREELASIPRMQALRAELLELAEDFYDELAVEAPEDARLGRTAAVTGADRAWVLELLGRRDEALPLFRAARSELETILEAETRDEQANETRLPLMRTLLFFSQTAHLAGRPEESLEAIERLHVLFDEVARTGTPAQAAQVHAWRESLAGHAGDVYVMLDQSDRALELYLQGIEDAERRYGSPPSTPEGMRRLALLLEDCGILTGSALGDRETEEAMVAEAVQLEEALYARSPQDREVQLMLVIGLTNLASVRTQLRRFDQAAAHLNRADGLAERLVEEYPNVPFHRYLRALALSNRAWMELQRERPLEAARAAGEACALLERLTLEQPNDPETTSLFGVALRNLALSREASTPDAAADVNDLLERSVQLAERALELFPDHPTYRSELEASEAERSSRLGSPSERPSSPGG